MHHWLRRPHWPVTHAYPDDTRAPLCGDLGRARGRGQLLLEPAAQRCPDCRRVAALADVRARVATIRNLLQPLQECVRAMMMVEIRHDASEALNRIVAELDAIDQETRRGEHG